LDCERVTAAREIFVRLSASIIVFRTIIVAVLDGDDNPSRVLASGTIGPDGVFRFRYTGHTGEYSFRGDYSGTLNAARGTLAGTEVFTGDGGTRTCKGMVFQAELPKGERESGAVFVLPTPNQ
jgi:hypothetical protein